MMTLFIVKCDKLDDDIRESYKMMSALVSLGIASLMKYGLYVLYSVME